MLLIISFILFILYTCVSVYKEKSLPISLSDTYYLWPKWMFPILMVIIAFSALPYWLDITVHTNYQFLSFLACSGLLFVACAPNFRKDRNHYPIHIICAYLAAATAVLSLTFVTSNWYMFFEILIIYGLLNYNSIKTSYIWIVEISIILATYCNIFIECLK